LHCRTGVHTGQVIAQGDDVFGDAVNTAARIVGLAAPGQILFSYQALDTLADRPQTRALPPMSVRGKQ
jgi:adenylate cyclase